MVRSKSFVSLTILIVFLSACGANHNVPEAEPIYNQAKTPITSKITEEELSQVSQRLYNNVTEGDADQILKWNDKQQALNLGFGFVWYPQSSADANKSTFPEYLQYLQNQGVPLPIWLVNAQKLGAPWATRQSFERSQGDPEIRELRRILETSKELQALFLLQRIQQNTPQMVQLASGKNRERLIYNLRAMQNTKGGLYPLLDYASYDEAGLSGVLSRMQKQKTNKRVLNAFAESVESNGGLGLSGDSFVEDRIQSYRTPIY